MENTDFESQVMQNVESIKGGEDDKMDASAMTGSVNPDALKAVIDAGVITIEKRGGNDADSVAKGVAHKIVRAMGAKDR